MLSEILNSDKTARPKTATPPSAPAPFVPSEVETIVPGGLKIGEPRIVIHTSFGDIKVKMYSAAAPRSVRMFLDLAKGRREFIDVKSSKKVSRPFYDGLTFHRVVPNELIQGGCPFGNGRGGPGFAIQDEIANNFATFDKPGMMALAPERDGLKPKPESNGSQFFITAAAQPEWNGQYTIIGEVVSGLEVVRKISRVRAGPTERPIRKVFIQSIDVENDASPTPEDQPTGQTAQ